jgi:hypothetical protein
MTDLEKLLNNMSPDTQALNRNLVGHLMAQRVSRGKPAANKYGAQRVEVDGIVFDSKKEARRYRQLKVLAQMGLISDLKLQPVFELQPAFTDAAGVRHLAITYRADFQYTEDGRLVIEDAKGVETEVFKLKKKLFLYRYEIDLRIT